MLRGFLLDLWRVACLCGQVRCPGGVCVTHRCALRWPCGGKCLGRGMGRVEDVAWLWDALGAGPVLPMVEGLEAPSSA